MNRGQSLDASERALQAALPRLPGRGQPGAAVEARILAAAREAAAGPAQRRRPRPWATPLGLAASLVIAAGLVWQLLPPEPAPATAEAVVAAPLPPAAVEAPPQPAPAAEPRIVPAPAKRVPVAKPAHPATATATPAPASRDPDPIQPPPPAPPSPPAPPASDAPRPLSSPSPAAEAAAEAAAAPAATAGAPQRVAAAQAASARSALPSRTASRDASPTVVADDDVPPATVDAPGVRDAWLRRIGELLAEGRMDEARESLAVFRKRYPDAVLPPELQPLEPELPPPAE